MQLMTLVQNVVPPVSLSIFYEESRFWLKAIQSWKNVIGRMIAETGNINASPEVTAEVARTAGELSLLEDRLVPLTREIENHCSKLLVTSDDAQMKIAHHVLYAKLLEEGNVFRNLLSEIFRLEEYAYRKFLS